MVHPKTLKATNERLFIGEYACKVVRKCSRIVKKPLKQFVLCLLCVFSAIFYYSTNEFSVIKKKTHIICHVDKYQSLGQTWVKGEIEMLKGILFHIVNDVIFLYLVFKERMQMAIFQKNIYTKYFRVNRAYIKLDDSKKY